LHPNISVVIPTHNRGQLLRRCIDSVVAATLSGDEIIVVDDGSSDGTGSLVQDYDDPRIRYTKQENAGVSAARNSGLAAARYDLIAFIDDDDEWHPQKLNVQRSLMEQHPEAVACFSNFWITDINGNEEPNYLLKWGQPVQSWSQLLGAANYYVHAEDRLEYKYYFGEHYFNQMLDDYVLPSSLLINRAKFIDELSFRVGMQRNSSWLFSSQVCRQGPVIYVDSDLACQHGDAANRLTAISRVDTLLSRLYVLEQEFGMNQPFLRDHRAAFERRLNRECNELFKAVMRPSVTNRKQILSENKRFGSRFALAAKLPNALLSLVCLVLSVARAGYRKLIPA